MLTIGVIGNGFVGKATQQFAQAPDVNLLVYDIDPSKCEPPGTTLFSVYEQAQLIFVCVPTPIKSTTSGCDTSIVEQVVKDLQSGLNPIPSTCGDGFLVSPRTAKATFAPAIIVRSTVPPGTCERLGVLHMPEYLTERNWERDFKATSCWELGIPTSIGPNAYSAYAHQIQRLLTRCKEANVIDSDELKLEHTDVTEMAKYMRNSMLATRIAVCNEYEAFCRARNIDYESVRQLACRDPRIGSSHTQVPGPDGKRGFGGTCLPKDLKALRHEMIKAGLDPMVLTACDMRNDVIDRPERDWYIPGRSVSEAPPATLKH